ncbi:MAG: hypothetical protein HY869_07590 [Chloroflexi bacterium]|nr:hypothetical protein [Chloroflexota bacterium]
MKIIKNEKLIERNSKIGNWSNIGGLLALVAAMYISFARPELFNYAIIAMLIGFTLTQISLYMGNRFGRSPRPDEVLDASLKGLSTDFAIYHFTTPISHLLVGPAGIWVLLPYRQMGVISYQKNRWNMTRGGFIQGYMRVFGQEGLGRPDADANADIKAIKTFLSRRMEEDQIPTVNAIAVFTNDKVELQTEEAPIPAVKLKQLKEFMRQKSRERLLSPTELEKIKSILPQEEE